MCWRTRVGLIPLYCYPAGRRKNKQTHKFLTPCRVIFRERPRPSFLHAFVEPNNTSPEHILLHTPLCSRNAMTQQRSTLSIAQLRRYVNIWCLNAFSESLGVKNGEHAAVVWRCCRIRRRHFLVECLVLSEISKRRAHVSLVVFLCYIAYVC